MQALRHWRNYLIHQEFILNTDHEALKYLNSQKTISARHAHWVSQLQEYNLLIPHKSGAKNKVADALSRRNLLLGTLAVQVIGFEQLKEQYEGDPDFKEIVQRCVNGRDPIGEFIWHDGYLFRGGQLCIPTAGANHLRVTWWWLRRTFW